MYILTPLILAQTIRYFILHYSHTTKLSQLLNLLHPLTMGALLGMLILLFGFQGNQILKHPGVVVLIAIPIIIQVYFNSMLVYGLSRVSKEQHVIAGPGALIGASNFFELAVATAISVFGLSSGATLATVVGVLIEVPVMLSIVKIINKSKNWYNCARS